MSTLVVAGAAESFRNAVTDGPLLLAVPVAMLAGVVSFLSPCVLPLVPGYLSFITGLSGADLAEEVDAESGGGRAHRRGRVALGSLLFVLGFSVVFVSVGAGFGALGAVFSEHRDGITRVLGAVVIVLGLSFMGVLSFVPWLSREVRVRRTPTAGLAGAPLLGVVFALGWTPCIGPTLGAVLTMAVDSATARRGAGLAFAYSLGLGLPFVVTALAFRRSMTAFALVKRHYRGVTVVGGAFLVVIGLLQVTGLWIDALDWIIDRVGVKSFTTAV